MALTFSPGLAPARRLPSPSSRSSTSLRPRVGPGAAATYQRRRLVVLSSVVAVLAAGIVALGYGIADAGPDSPVTATSGRVVIVHSGDTLWTIARTVQPSGDPRALVARLERSRQRHGPLAVGERIALPG